MTEPAADPRLNAQAAAAAQYEALLNEAMSAQRSFDSRSLLSEQDAALGQAGLHFVSAASDVESLLSHGAPINGVRRIDYGDQLQHLETPLLTAFIDQRFEVAGTLVRFGADVNAPNAALFPDGRVLAHTALHMLASRKEQVGARVLIEAGADVNLQTTWGTTPLHFAAENDDTETVSRLLSAGARTDIRDLNGALPIDQAGPASRRLLG